MKQNFIEQILIGEYQSVRKHVLRLAYPRASGDPFSINVVCGKNNTGKTHILKQLSEAFHSRRKFHNSSRAGRKAISSSR